MRCPVCDSDSCEVKRELYDDRFGFKGRYKLVECGLCGHRHLDGIFTDALLKKLYTDYYPRSSFNLEDYKPHTETGGFRAWFDGENYAAFRWVPENVRVLDIGCGFGETLGYHGKRGCDVYGVEADENIRRIAEKFGYAVHVGLFDPKLYEPCFFDYVTLDQVIEHTVDPVETLRGVERVLKPGGAVVLSMPNSNGWGARLFGNRWIHWHAPYHIQHFTVRSMEMAAKKAGLTMESCRTVTLSVWLHYQFMHLLTRPVEGDKSIFWSGEKEAGSKRLFMVYAVGFLIRKTKVYNLITRFFDALKLGDNFIFILRKQAR